jgi:hypothetical protein
VSGIVRDASTGEAGLGAPASEPMPQQEPAGLPSANPENPSLARWGTAAQPEGGIGETGPQADEPTGEDALRQQFESKFQVDKANLQKAHNERVSRLERELFDMQDRTYASTQRERALQARLKEMVEKFGGDEGDLALLRVAADDAERAALSQTARHRETVEQWHNRQETGHRNTVQEWSIDAETGTRLFDPNDADIQAAYETYLPLGLQAMRSGGSDLEQRAVTAFNELQNVIKRKREEGLKRASGQPTRTPEENRALNTERGPQNRGDGTNANITSDSLMEESKRLYPNDRMSQYTYWAQKRAEHGISG